jgi:2-oxoglutarate dehydrogenase E2 component (dihydrolipoamide succinyltransferase)
MQIEIKVPSVGESITEVEIGQWLKKEGERVGKDENIVVIESEKTTLELPAPSAGVISKITKQKGETAKIGEVIALFEQGAAGTAPAPTAESGKGQAQSPAALSTAPAAPTTGAGTEKEPRVMPAAARVMAEQGLKAEDIQGTGPGGRILKEDALKRAESKEKPAASTTPPAPVPAAAPESRGGARRETAEAEAPATPAQTSARPAPAEQASSGVPVAFREEQVVPMTRLRKTLAERLVQAQQTAALLTTFNEVDMTEIMNLRKQHQDAFTQRYGLKLGFMSFFVKAVIDALRLIPAVNAEVRGTDIIYRNYYDIGVAVGGGRGLVVPVLRNAERMSFAQIETAIGEFAKRAKENKLKLEELQGGTFTISNGGVYGSLLSTPIVNPPQSGILGMHAIQERPVAREGQVVIRPMMYLALTYDHRIVDGREAVTFLKRIKDVLENPARMLLEV